MRPISSRCSRSLLRAGLLVLAGLSLSGCAGTPVRPGESRPTVVRRDPRVLTRLELESAGTEASALDAVFRLRPLWLRARDNGLTSRQVLLFLNEAAYDLSYLRQLPVSAIERVERLSASEAYSRWGDRTRGAEVLYVVIHTGL